MLSDEQECPFCGKMVKVKLLSNDKDENILECTICKKSWKEAKQ